MYLCIYILVQAITYCFEERLKNTLKHFFIWDFSRKKSDVRTYFAL